MAVGALPVVLRRAARFASSRRWASSSTSVGALLPMKPFFLYVKRWLLAGWLVPTAAEGAGCTHTREIERAETDPCWMASRAFG